MGLLTFDYVLNGRYILYKGEEMRVKVLVGQRIGYTYVTLRLAFQRRIWCVDIHTGLMRFSEVCGESRCCNKWN